VLFALDQSTDLEVLVSSSDFLKNTVVRLIGAQVDAACVEFE
jgi:hypothetical protein